MAIHVNKRREQKVARINNEWANVHDSFFDELHISREKLAEMEQQLLGQIVLPCMPGFNKDRQEAILTPYSAFPLIIVYCEIINDVRLCLQWAKEYDWWVTSRSGGHSFAGFSVNSGMVIDLSRMDHVCVDRELKQARVQPGTQFHKLDAVLQMYDLHLTSGTCPDVAVAGYMQGGGYGLMSREFGMHLDSVIEVLMMLYDGRIVVANESQNADLFWAVRGGTGGNFGILLETKYALNPLGQIWGFCLQWPMAEAPQALHELQNNYMKTGAPKQLGYMAVWAIIKGTPTLLMIGVYNGQREEGLQAIASLRACGAPKLQVDKVGKYGELGEALFGLLPGIPPGQPMITRSGYIADLLSVEDWQGLTEFFATSVNPYNIVGIEAYGGAINEVAAEATAFIHRDVSMDMFMFGFLDKPQGSTEKDEAWIDAFGQRMAPYQNGHMYQNYPQRDHPDFRWMYWGDAFNSLLFVKQKYDPHDFFNFEQSISPYPEEGDIHRSRVPSMFSDPEIVYEPY